MLSPTQKSLLTVAAQCADRAIRWPATLRGGARTKVIAAMLDAGFAENAAGTLVLTDAGMRAAGVEPAPSQTPDPILKTGKPPRRRRDNTKLAHLIAMLQTEQGASMDELCTVLGWRQHTVRAAISHQLKKQRGMNILSTRVDGVGRVYRIVTEG
jgi:hypothetical protein